jgi:hypothetical protein
VPTEDRFSQYGTQGKIVTLSDVPGLECYASHRTLDGHLYEFDQGHFWHTDLADEEPTRELVEDLPSLPVGPWYHHSLCDCEVCGARA